MVILHDCVKFVVIMKSGREGGGRIEAVYTYTYISGRLLVVIKVVDLQGAG